MKKKRDLKSFQNKASLGHDFLPKEGLFFDNLITLKELSGGLGIAPKTIQNWMAKRQIPFVKIGQKTYFRKDRLKTWIEQKEFKSCL